MKVEQIFDIYPLAEALRMDSRMSQLAHSAKDEFRFGIEYEFNVDSVEENESAEERVRDDPDAMDVIRERTRDQISDDVSSSLSEIADFIYELFDGANNEYLTDKRSFKAALDIDEDEEDLREENADNLDNIIRLFQSYRGDFDKRSDLDPPKSVLQSINLNLDDMKAASKEAIDIELSHGGMTYERMVELIQGGKVDMIQDVIEDLDDFGFNSRAARTKSDIINLISEKIQDEASTDQDVEDYYRSMESSVIEDFVENNVGFGNEDSSFEAKRDIIQNYIEDRGIASYIEDIEPDPSVPDGVEVITNPLDFEDTMDVMEEMFDIIKTRGSTTNKTGMHVNISHESFQQGETPDPLKLAALVDIDFFQNQSSKKFVKYDPRDPNVMSMSKIIGTEGLQGIAQDFIKGGFDALEKQFKKQLTSTRSQGINWENILTNFDSGSRRIEFRFFGGEGYENRKAEINKDILFLMAAIKVMTDDRIKPEEYKKGVVRLLNRLIKNNKNIEVDTFSEFVSQIQRGGSTIEITPALMVNKGFDDSILVDIMAVNEKDNRPLFTIQTEIEYDEERSEYVADDLNRSMTLKHYAYNKFVDLFYRGLNRQGINEDSLTLAKPGVQRALAFDFVTKARNARIDPDNLVVPR